MLSGNGPLESEAMAERCRGTLTRWTEVAPGLAIFRLAPESGRAFPAYAAGQYIALTREGCRLTTRVVDDAGHVSYRPAIHADGSPAFGSVTHSYSLSSAPFDTAATGEIEIYIGLERVGPGQFGRLTESLFRSENHVGDTVAYVNRIVGNFTLETRAKDARHVLMVGTGTGLAPFVGMMKQAAHDARTGRGSDVQYTLIHAHRTPGELGYDAELLELADAHIAGFDFAYVRSVSRPAAEDRRDARLCVGRANNLLRALFDLPLLEQEPAARVTHPEFGAAVSKSALRDRLPRGGTTVMTCGNRDLMEDVRRIASLLDFRFEMEEW